MSYPVGWDLVNITGTYVGRNGVPCVGSVTLSSPQLVLRSGTIVPAADIVFDLVNGTFSGQIPATDDPNAQPSGWVYTVTENVPGGRQGYQIVAPHTSPGIDLSTVIPVTLPMPPTFGFPYVTLAQLAGTAVGSGAYLVGFIQNGTGAVATTVQAKLLQTVNVNDYGADPTGIIDSTAAFQAAINYANTMGRDVEFEGTFKLSAPGIVINNSADTSSEGFRCSLLGRGPRQSVLNFGAGSYTGISFIGPTTGAGILSWQHLRGCSVLKVDNLGVGVAVNSASRFNMNDVCISGANIGLSLTDVISSVFTSVIVTFANGGVVAEIGSSSTPNVLTFVGCIFGNNNNFGGDFIDPSALNFVGCSFEGNNTSQIGGAAATWGVRVSFTSDAQQGGTMGAIFSGCYFENNGINGVSTIDTGDVWVVNSASPISVGINNCTFQRHSFFTTNCIRVDTSGGNHTQISVNGCGFRGYSDYTASSSRPYVLLSDPSDTVRITAFGNEYQNLVEAPVFTNADNVTPDFIPNAWVRFNGTTAVIQASANVASVTRSSMGVYSINFAHPLINSSSFCYGTSLIGVSGFVEVTSESSTSVTINVFNSAGSAVDAQVSLMVYGGGRLN